MAPKNMKQNKIDAEPLLAKLGAKKLEGCNKVSFYRGQDEYQIMQPVVFYNELTQTYYFIGEPRITNYQDSAQQIMQMFQNTQKSQHPENCDCDDHKHNKQEDVEEKFTKEDIKSVMEEGNVDETKARELLDQHKDVVNAVLACNNEKKQ
uniref:NAC domain-containing protein n=1 Tax=Trepomonas sp. PC1 TaxID=1076344 RepID=A0A146KGD5_9EUKA|eukprot:JAP94944.1 NAC domain-containing protein [Trepomonas sp. PC1]